MPEIIAGILGGMGPEATVDLMQRIIRLTPAMDDIDHIRCIVDNNPKVPSRIKALIEKTGESPGPVMADMARRLEAWGAHFLAIPCNTAHYYRPEVQAAVNIPVLDLIDITALKVKELFPCCQRVGILASTAVRMTGLYENRFKEDGVEVVFPEEPDQDALLGIIKKVKAGKPVSETGLDFDAVCKRLLQPKGPADVLIIACTELSVIADALTVDFLDAAEVLAAHIVKLAKTD